MKYYVFLGIIQKGFTFQIKIPPINFITQIIITRPLFPIASKDNKWNCNVIILCVVQIKCWPQAEWRLILNCRQRLGKNWFRLEEEVWRVAMETWGGRVTFWGWALNVSEPPALRYSPGTTWHWLWALFSAC